MALTTRFHVGLNVGKPTLLVMVAVYEDQRGCLTGAAVDETTINQMCKRLLGSVSRDMPWEGM